MLVFDDEQRLLRRARQRRQICGSRGIGIASASVRGSQIFESRTVAARTLHVDPTACMAHDAVRRTQSEPGARAHCLSGKERFEDPLLNLRTHTHARIGNRKDGITGPAGPRSRDAADSSISLFPVSITICPPRGMASRALITRFIRTWPSCSGSAIDIAGLRVQAA